VLRGWIIERAGEEAEPLFVSNRNKQLSRDAEELTCFKLKEVK